MRFIARAGRGGHTDARARRGSSPVSTMRAVVGVRVATAAAPTPVAREASAETVSPRGASLVNLASVSRRVGRARGLVVVAATKRRPNARRVGARGRRSRHPTRARVRDGARRPSRVAPAGRHPGCEEPPICPRVFRARRRSPRRPRRRCSHDPTALTVSSPVAHVPHCRASRRTVASSSSSTTKPPRIASCDSRRNSERATSVSVQPVAGGARGEGEAWTISSSIAIRDGVTFFEASIPTFNANGSLSSRRRRGRLRRGAASRRGTRARWRRRSDLHRRARRTSAALPAHVGEDREVGAPEAFDGYTSTDVPPAALAYRSVKQLMQQRLASADRLLVVATRRNASSWRADDRRSDTTRPAACEVCERAKRAGDRTSPSGARSASPRARAHHDARGVEPRVFGAGSGARPSRAGGERFDAARDAVARGDVVLDDLARRSRAAPRRRCRAPRWLQERFAA